MTEVHPFRVERTIDGLTWEPIETRPESWQASRTARDLSLKNVTTRVVINDNDDAVVLVTYDRGLAIVAPRVSRVM